MNNGNMSGDDMMVESNSDVALKAGGVVAEGVNASVTVSLHPLVIMNMSEHYTRTRAQENIANPQGKISSVAFQMLPTQISAFF